MEKTWYMDMQITFALGQAETGTPVKEVIRKIGISEQTFCCEKTLWRAGAPNEVRSSKILEEENRRLKQMKTVMSLNKHMFQDVLSIKL